MFLTVYLYYILFVVFVKPFRKALYLPLILQIPHYVILNLFQDPHFYTQILNQVLGDNTFDTHRVQRFVIKKWGTQACPDKAQ
ncbi:hypothetical protein A2610_02410 [Candidatus Wolfebacteria bacterium RIFOXYD1_FULL_48_65]|uniref:Uncharacterized protein n=1 Tax=Candidatus Wolfebacteria bacterium RIFOXYD1_FULL_48_65 TaxID=1802561 RepID=A0A1F8E4N2_9BACT|nr:MAG: hypothetical protein A2610_02410 [Candidatus Wolfebacteria bacterium RIFOXYD1_FULL_48_65]